MEELNADITLDLRGLKCPAVEFEAAKTIFKMSKGTTLRLISDDPVAKKEIPNWCRQLGHKMLEAEVDELPLNFLIQKAS